MTLPPNAELTSLFKLALNLSHYLNAGIASQLMGKRFRVKAFMLTYLKCKPKMTNYDPETHVAGQC